MNTRLLLGGFLALTTPIASANAMIPTANDPSTDTAALSDAQARVQASIAGRKLSSLATPHFDRQADDTLWARGNSYKASFDASGATFYPFFGSETPRHFPMRMRLAGATSGGEAIALAVAEKAERDGTRVAIDRGGIDEVYETGVAGMEQTFVVASRPQGDLKLFVSIDTELAASEKADGFVFANEYGEVAYGRAFVREPSGAKHPVATRLVEGGVEIEVEAEYLAQATFPLVVDPYIGQVGFTASLAQRTGAIAFDASSNRFCVAIEEVVNASDGDVRLMSFDYAGTTVTTGDYVDASTEDWRAPAIANSNGANMFLVAASVGNYPGFTVPGLQYRMVVTRAITAANLATMFPKSLLLVTETGLNNRYDVSVGGNATTGSTTPFLVAWQELVPGGAVIEARRTNANGLPVGNVVVVSTNDGTSRPSVSKNCSSTGTWSLAWERSNDIYGARVDTNGTLVTGEFAIANTANFEVDPCVATPFDDGTYAVSWQQNATAGGERDIHFGVFSGSSLVAQRNVSADNAATQSWEQRMPEIDCDGERVVVVYAEENALNSLDFDIYASSYFSVSGVLPPSERHVAINSSNSNRIEPTVVSTAGSGGNGLRFGLAFTLQGVTDDAFGGLYDLPNGGTATPFCFGDGTHNACPCGNVSAVGRGCPNSGNASGALLTATGTVRLGLDSLVLTGSGMPSGPALYFQGTNQPGMGVPFGDGLRCTVGTIVRLGIKTNVGGTSSFPSGSDPKLSVAGNVASPATRTYQCWYRDSASFCSVSTFNLTNAMYVVWAQ